jgi:carbonic anhydrase
MTMDRIRKRSSILSEMEEQGQIKITGALYEMDTGRVAFLD